MHVSNVHCFVDTNQVDLYTGGNNHSIDFICTNWLVSADIANKELKAEQVATILIKWIWLADLPAAMYRPYIAVQDKDFVSGDNSPTSMHNINLCMILTMTGGVSFTYARSLSCYFLHYLW